MSRSTSQKAHSPAAVLAVDLGGTWLRVAIIRPPTQIVARERIRTPGHGEPERVIPAILELASRLAQRTELAVSAAGVAAPGPLDPRSGTVFEVPNLAGWQDVPLAEQLSAALQVPVWVHNDANLAGLAEARHGAGRGKDPLLYLTLSTGIGGGIVCGGQIYAGRHGLAGELGHVIVQDGGPACNFGHRGCLEALASGTAIARQVQERLAAGEASCVPAFCGAEPISARAVAEAARAGDPLAASVFASAGRALGVALASFANIFDPEYIVLGGGVAASLPLLTPHIERALDEVVMARDRRQMSYGLGALGDDAGLMGAAIYACDCVKLFSEPSIAS